MPDKIWLHKDTKYSTGDVVCGYQYDFVQGIEDEERRNWHIRSNKDIYSVYSRYVGNLSTI